MNVREKIESFERLTLIPEASSAINSKGRKVYERKHATWLIEIG